MSFQSLEQCNDMGPNDRLKGKKLVRVQFEMSRNGLGDLEKLMADTDCSTKKDALNAALTLLDWGVRQRKDGRLIVSMDEHGDCRELVMPELEYAFKRGNDTLKTMDSVDKTSGEGDDNPQVTNKKAGQR